MVRTIYIFATIICAIFLNTPSQAQSSVPLSFFIQSDDGFIWSWFDPKETKTREIHTFKEKPVALYWEKDRKTIRVIDQGEIISFAGSGNLLQAAPIALPQMLANEIPIALWRDANDLNLRIATWIVVKPTQVQGNIIKLNNSMTIPVMTDPEWGWHAVARLFKRESDMWVVEHALATKTEAGDTPGLSVLKPFWNEEGASNLQLASQKYCGRYGSAFMGRRCDDRHTDVNIRNAFYDFAFPSCKRTENGDLHPKDCGAMGSDFLTCETCRFDLVHATSEGDSLHAMSPTFLRDKESGHFQIISSSQKDQISVDVNGQFSFIEDHTSVTIIDLNSGKYIFQKEGTGAFWLPSD